MPKEIIRDTASMYDVRVGWERDRWVQVGVTTADGTPLVEKLNGGGDPVDLAHFQGVWGTFDRDGCNRLIRILRTARDQAFGRDE